MKVTYFVSYRLPDGQYGMADMTGDKDIESYDDIKTMAEKLEGLEKQEPIIILNFIKLNKLSTVARRNIKSKRTKSKGGKK